jgi:hypothetical protein
MIRIPGTSTILPGVQTATRPTAGPDAWLGEYLTIELTGPMTAMRVHMNAGEGAATEPHLALAAGPFGRWFAVGDFVQTYDDYRSTHSLPTYPKGDGRPATGLGHFTHYALCRLLPGTIVNVGRCSPLFGGSGGGEQVEYVAGPAPQIQPSTATSWSNVAGHA